LPARLNRFFDALANNEFKVSVDAIDEKTLILGFQKIANRIKIANYRVPDCRRCAANAIEHEFSDLGLSRVGDYIFALRGRRRNCSALEHSFLR
jgi:hypothetical protein